MHELDNRIPKSISLVVAKMLHKSPEKRYQCGRGIVRDLLHCKRVIELQQAIKSHEDNTADNKESATACENRMLQEEESNFVPGRCDVSDIFFIAPNKAYGRETDFRMLLKTYNKARSSETSQVILIRGYAGKRSFISPFSLTTKHFIVEGQCTD